MKNKQIKEFYKKQNQALNDWLEVDSVVRSIADDILESFDPDRDHDGLLEHGGALQAEGEDVEAFLPKEERENRKKAERSAKRAINVSHPTPKLFNPQVFSVLTRSTDQRYSQYFSSRCQSRRLLFLFVLVPDRIDR